MKKNLFVVFLLNVLSYNSYAQDTPLSDLILSFMHPKSSYTPGEAFPLKGYNLSKVAMFRECSINKFPDVDTLYYMKVVKPGMKERTFYFMMLSSKDIGIILNNALNKNLKNKTERMKWLNAFLTQSEIEIAERKNNRFWTFHRTIPGKGGMGTIMLDYETAKKEFYRQRGYDRNGRKVSLADEFASWMLIIKAMGYMTPSGKYYCNGLEFNSYADMEDYKNAQGLK